MKKPSLKSKLTADKIEEANRLLSEQIKASNQPVEIITAPKVMTKAADNTELIQLSENEVQISQKPTTTKSDHKPKVKATTKQAVVREPKEVKGSKFVRVTIDVPEDLHEKLKIKMILSKQTIKDYLLNFIEKDLSKMDFKF